MKDKLSMWGSINGSNKSGAIKSGGHAKELTSSAIDIIEFNSELLGPEQVFDYWREGLEPLFLSEMNEGHNAKNINQKLATIGSIIVAKGGFSSQSFIRDRKHLLRNDDSDHILVQWYTKGGCRGSNGERSFVQSAGHIVLLDLGSECYSSSVSSYSEVISIVLPRELLREFWGPIGNLSGISLPVNSAKGLLLKSFMLSLCEELHRIKMEDAGSVAQATMQMVSSMFQNDVDKVCANQGLIEIELKSVIKEFISLNAHNPRLGTDMLTKQFHCSRAKLYRLFQSNGGVRRYINQLRLQRCYKELLSNRIKRSRIAKISENWGFNNPQQFTRQFKQYFGLSPSDLLHNFSDQLTSRQTYDSSDGSRKMAAWIRAL